MSELAFNPATLMLNAIAAAEARQASEPTTGKDYTDPEGLLVCGECHRHKQMRLDVPLIGERIVPILCACGIARRDAEEARREAEQRQIRINELRMDGIRSRDHLGMTFDADDGSDPKMATIARNYVENWRQIREQPSPGLLLTGGVGGGKTFWAVCIANAMIDRGYSALVTNVPTLIQGMAEDFERNKRRILDNIAGVDLLVLDDVGFERSTSYAHEKLFEIIDARYLSKRPLIVTTNLSFPELENPAQMEYKRVFDRIIGMTRPLHVKADGRRKRIAQESSRTMDKLLGLS